MIILTDLPKHIYYWHVEVWSQLGVAFSAEFIFILSIIWMLGDWLLDWQIYKKMIWCEKNHLKLFSIISITSKWIESSRLVFPRPKFFKVFKENLKMCTFLFKVLKKNHILIYNNKNCTFEIPLLCVQFQYFFISFIKYLLCTPHCFPVLFKIPKAPLLNLNGTIQSGAF